MSHTWNDWRFALRSLRRGRAVTAFAVLAFALGIGITTAVFTLFYSVLLKPLPFPDPDRLVVVYDVQPACKTCPASFEKHVEWSARSTSFSALGGSSTLNAVITGAGEPERVPAVRATHTLTKVFGLEPAIGRWFTAAEDTSGGPKVVVLSDPYWRRQFAGDRAVLGRTLTIEGEPHQVIGVMPREFQHRRGEIFLPVARAFDAANRGNHFLLTYGRLKPGVTLARADEEMTTLGAAFMKEFGHNHTIDVADYYQAVVGTVVEPLRMLMGAVGLVLLIACANVANLLLASGLARRRELAVRAALGATRWDLARQLTIESVALALAGGALGVLLAQWAVSTFVQLAGTTLPRAAFVRIDAPVVAFAFGLSLVTGLVCGLWPVVRLNSRTLGRDVREGDLRSGSHAGGRRFGNGLVVAEIALAFTLLVGAGLLIKNLARIERQDIGFSSARLVAFDLAPSGARYRDQETLKSFFRDLPPRLSALPGVTGVGLTSHLPMYQFGWNGEVTLDAGNPWDPKAAPLIERAWVGADYFGTMGIAIVRGRAFDDRDRQGATRVTIISERTAEKFWPGQNPIGRRFARGGTFGGNNPITEVVGVARDVRTYGLTQQSPYLMYVPIEQEPFSAMTVVLRTDAANPTSVMPLVRQVVASQDPLLPVARVQTLTDVVSQSVSQPRLISSLTSLFGALAGFLAAVGVYGVMAYNVRRERRAFAIRLALGADPRAVRRLVLRRGLVLGTLGVVCGAGGALLLTRTIQTLLTNVEAADPMVFGITAGALLVVTVVSGYLPAFQASRTDPLVVLRAD
jgi:putative ABC transport system permease protein